MEIIYPLFVVSHNLHGDNDLHKRVYANVPCNLETLTKIGPKSEQQGNLLT